MTTASGERYRRYLIRLRDHHAVGPTFGTCGRSRHPGAAMNALAIVTSGRVVSALPATSINLP